MNAEKNIPVTWNIPAIVKSAGGTDHAYDVDRGVLQVMGTTQERLDAAVAAYDPLPEIRARAAADIDAAAGAARARYITIAPGQEATYLLKAQQARDFQAAGHAGPVPSLVQAEADATGETAEAACERIRAEEAAWVAKAAQIEAVRRRGKIQVAAAADVAAVAAVREAFLAELAAL